MSDKIVKANGQSIRPSEQCGNCFYWARSPFPDDERARVAEQQRISAGGAPNGHCFHAPPTAVLVPIMRPGTVATQGQSYMDHAPGAVWPPVDASRWCGAYTTAPGAKIKVSP